MAKNVERKTEKTPATTSGITPWEQMERLMDEFLPGRWMHRWGAPAWDDLMPGMRAPSPSVDVLDRDDEVVVKAEIPGVRKEDVELSVTDNTLTISGETQHEEKEEKENYSRREIRRGAFSRTVTLPAAVDTDKATAKFEDGMLVVSMPKVTKTSRKRVEIA
ncbi:Hsp20/alpha crystallin family protein [Thiohalocapsa sp.]|jgi:HSP20 family protein|uniref:Hsp20/alpha crystallin family protein n=1 Tax=Thiohalocapsa sp. TaxID=2497641 RepID=UPI0025F5A45C|nr:Hsp20/alpha crystallin family protein [Thiohalocapsa sp.]